MPVRFLPTALVSLLVSSCAIVGGSSSASQSGSTTLAVTVQGEVVTIVQKLSLRSTVPLTSYAQGRLLDNPPTGGAVSGRLLDVVAVQRLAAGSRPLKVAVKSSPAGLTVTGMQASRSEHLELTYRVSGLVNDSVLTVPTPGSLVGRWSRVEVEIEAPTTAGRVSTAAGSQTQVQTNEASSQGWRYVLTSVPGGSPAVTLTSLR